MARTTDSFTLRIPVESRKEFEAAAAAEDYKTLATFILDAARQRVREGRQRAELEAMEVDTLARSFYACVPELDSENMPVAVAAARIRHARFIKTVRDNSGCES